MKSQERKAESGSKQVEKLIEALLEIGGKDEFLEINVLLQKYSVEVSSDLIDRVVLNWVKLLGYGHIDKDQKVDILSVLIYSHNADLITDVRLAYHKAGKEPITPMIFRDLLSHLDTCNAMMREVCESLKKVFAENKQATTGMLMDALSLPLTSLLTKTKIVSGVAMFFADTKRWNVLDGMVTNSFDVGSIRYVLGELCRSGEVKRALAWQKAHAKEIPELRPADFALLTEAVKKRGQKK